VRNTAKSPKIDLNKRNYYKPMTNNKDKQEKIRELASKMRNEDCNRIGWRLVAPWGYYRDQAERELTQTNE